MNTLEGLLIAYLVWLCRILGVGLEQIEAARDDDSEVRAPRPERARQYHF